MVAEAGFQRPSTPPQPPTRGLVEAVGRAAVHAARALRVEQLSLLLGRQLGRCQKKQQCLTHSQVARLLRGLHVFTQIAKHSCWHAGPRPTAHHSVHLAPIVDALLHGPVRQRQALVGDESARLLRGVNRRWVAELGGTVNQREAGGARSGSQLMENTRCGRARLLPAPHAPAQTGRAPRWAAPPPTPACGRPRAGPRTRHAAAWQTGAAAGIGHEMELS